MTTHHTSNSSFMKHTQLWISLQMCAINSFSQKHGTVRFTCNTVISEGLCQKHESRAGTSNYMPQILWDAISCPCSWYLLLAQQSPYLARYCMQLHKTVITLRPRQNGRHFADDIFKCIFVNENEWISIKISLKFVLKGPINNIPASVQIMAWCRPGDKPLSGPRLVRLPDYPSEVWAIAYLIIF